MCTCAKYQEAKNFNYTLNDVHSPYLSLRMIDFNRIDHYKQLT